MADDGRKKGHALTEQAKPGDEPGFAVQLREDLDAADAGHVLSVFAADLVRLQAAIATAAATGQAALLRISAHALAGAAGAVGASDLDRCCRLAMNDRSDARESLAAHASHIAAAAAAAGRALGRVEAELGPGSAADR